jgi:hypothetical protein
LSIDRPLALFRLREEKPVIPIAGELPVHPLEMFDDGNAI